MLQHRGTLKRFMLNERRQSQKITYCIFHLYDTSKAGTSIVTERTLVLLRLGVRWRVEKLGE